MIKYVYCIFVLVLLIFCSTPQPIDKSLDTIPGFSPIKDDELAKRYAPLLELSKEFGDPYSLYYRASKDLAGNTHITYHFFWEGEENTGSGMGPFFNRILYTGGLKLQKKIFGKADIELVSLVIDKSGKIQEVGYETAENYDPNKFGVKHKHIERKELHKEPILFKIISWNHLFDYVGDNTNITLSLTRLTPKYFAQTLWEEYEMVKEKESFFSRSRAHKPYEREFVE